MIRSVEPDDTMMPDRLKLAWQAVEAKEISIEEFNLRQQALMSEYRDAWRRALLTGSSENLAESLVKEVAEFFCIDDITEARRRCQQGVTEVKDDWREQVKELDRSVIEAYYDKSQGYIYDLMWWHNLLDDESPLGYATALEFGRQQGCSRYLDFGSGVGAGAILFGRNGFDITLADISSTLLEFSRWRLAMRTMGARLIDLKISPLPENTFDLITAMDVFEHLVDPVGAVDDLHRALKPGGYLFGRFHAEFDKDHPQHIVLDFGPVFDRLAKLGFREVWRDEWLWGHQVFQKE